MKPETFLAGHTVFSRRELAVVLRRRGRTEATVDSHLTRWRRQGRIARVKPGVFLRLAAAPAGPALVPDFVAIASRMAPDAVLAYHTALEVHGVAQSAFERLTFLTWTKARPTSFQGRRFTPVRPRAPLLAAEGGERWTESADRGGVEIRVTTIERTVADVLDRPDLRRHRRGVALAPRRACARSNSPGRVRGAPWEPDTRREGRVLPRVPS